MSVSSLGLGGGPITSATSHFYRAASHTSHEREPPTNVPVHQTRPLPLLPHPDSRDLLANQRVRLDPNSISLAKRKRASRPKVRSGCITCKIRRVKCDERKPTCARCEKADVECDGYAKDPPGAVDKDAQPDQSAMLAAQRARRHILPRPGAAAEDDRRVVTARASSARQLLRANPGVVQIDGSDVSYYDLFRNQLIRDLSGSLHSEFWSRIVLSESTRDPCVRESILAIGALSQTLFFAAQSGGAPAVRRPLEDLSAKSLDHHHRAALKHHIRAVSVYRRRIQQAADGASPRSVIIMTLLLIAFELIQGNMKTVDMLMGTGMRLIENSITLVQRPSEQPDPEPRSLSPPESRREDEMDDIEHLLPCMSLMSGFTHFFSSHRASIRLMKSSPTHELPTPGVTPLPKLQTLWGQFYTRAVVHVMRTLHDQLAYNRLEAAAVVGEQRSFLARIAAWQAVLDRYLADPAFRDDERARRTLAMIQIHRLLIYILISCGLDRCDMTFDLFEPEFREVLDRCGALIRDQEPLSKICFTFGEGLTSPLATVICKCRNHDLRMRAARLVNSISWRDGAWDGKLLAIGKLGTAMLEEKGMDEKGFIPADSRWIWKDAKWDLERRELTATYCKLMPNADGGRTHAQLVLDMDHLPDVCSQWGCPGRHDPFESS